MADYSTLHYRHQCKLSPTSEHNHQTMKINSTEYHLLTQSLFNITTQMEKIYM